MTVTEQLSALDSILAHGDLHCLFQPILSLSERRLVGYEALTRGPSNSPLHSRPWRCSPWPANADG